MTANSEETCKILTQNCLEEFIKEKKSDQRAQAFLWKIMFTIFLSPFRKVNRPIALMAPHLNNNTLKNSSLALI